MIVPSAADEANRNADTSKAAGTTDTMKVSLGVDLAVSVVWEILSNGQ